MSDANRLGRSLAGVLERRACDAVLAIANPGSEAFTETLRVANSHHERVR